VVGFLCIKYKNISKIFTHRIGFILLISLSLVSAHITDYSRANTSPSSTDRSWYGRSLPTKGTPLTFRSTRV